ncbi:MAG: GNAT family N-acetyltransferase [candidate division WOR-3 bacterium]|nr:MAG: GNAT family N-acetyltransferase [candidate division WOR-3 bacterium]
MNNTIKKIPLRDLDVFISIIGNAYPAFGIASDQDREKMRQRMVMVSKDPTIAHYGVYRGRKLVGGMRTYDFNMNLFSIETMVGGVGLVAVDLLHKKQKACRDLIMYFIHLYQRKGSSMVALYPFRPDFYRKMGFGYGAKLNLYRIQPEDLPSGGSREHLRYLAPGDRKVIKECSDRFWQKHHGMFKIKKHELDYFFKNPAAKTVVYEDHKRIRGYLSFVFKRADDENMLKNHIVIRELVYENRDVLRELLAFLRVQSDQIPQILFPTQDDMIHFLVKDPRDGSDNIIPMIGHQTNTQGVGVMYRVIDTRKIFRLLANHQFGGQSYRLKLSIHDSFLKDNNGSVVLQFDNGRASTKKGGAYDVEVTLDVSDFSSLLVGSVDYETLYRYGLTDISDAQYVDTVANTFRVKYKPICHTTF